MRIDLLTIFPNLLESPLQEGMIRRAQQSNKVKVIIHNLRDYTVDRQQMTDDRPFGGGEGMVMKPEPLAAAVNVIRQQSLSGHVVLLSPQGKLYCQETAQKMAVMSHLILVCGRYEGVDERFIQHYVDEEISIGNYILTGGELAAMVMIDSIIRLLPGVLGCVDSAANDTFSRGGLKHPQFTRPRLFESAAVPAVLLSGDHAVIAKWRFVAAIKQTLKKRADLLSQMHFTSKELILLEEHGLLDSILT